MKYLPLVLANLRRSPLRSVLTAAAIAFAIALVCLLRSMPGALESILDYAASGSRVVVQNKAGFEYPLPYAYLQKVRALPGVVSAVSWTWYGGVYEVEKGVTFPSFATEPDQIAEVFPDWQLPPEMVESFQRHRDGAIIGRATAKSYGWEVGDRVTLRGDTFPVDLELVIIGIVPHDLSPVMLLQREYFDQALQAIGSGLDFASLFYVRVDDRARLEPLAREIDALFRNSGAQTLTESEKDYFKTMFSALDAFIAITIVVSVLVALCIVFIAANTASLSVRERAGELAVLKSMGFRKRLLFRLLIAEVLVIALVGGAAGALGSFLITLGLHGAATGLMPQLGPLGSFVITRAIAVQGLFLAVFIGMIAGAVPSWGASRRGVAETMRELF
ncbi:MAG: FtsX-like permease family protein [Myxococcota bacterium]